MLGHEVCQLFAASSISLQAYSDSKPSPFWVFRTCTMQAPARKEMQAPTTSLPWLLGQSSSPFALHTSWPALGPGTAQYCCPRCTCQASSNLQKTSGSRRRACGAWLSTCPWIHTCRMSNRGVGPARQRPADMRKHAEAHQPCRSRDRRSTIAAGTTRAPRHPHDGGTEDDSIGPRPCNCCQRPLGKQHGGLQQ